MDPAPDPGGPKTCGYCGSGSRSPTLSLAVLAQGIPAIQYSSIPWNSLLYLCFIPPAHPEEGAGGQPGPRPEGLQDRARRAARAAPSRPHRLRFHSFPGDQLLLLIIYHFFPFLLYCVEVFKNLICRAV
jgi:hypothetical protein